MLMGRIKAMTKNTERHEETQAKRERTNMHRKSRAKIAIPPEQMPSTGGVDPLEVIRQEQNKSRKARENARMKLVADKLKQRGDGPEMRLALNESNDLAITYSHEDAASAAILLMADIGTCDPHFYRGISEQVATLGLTGSRVDQVTSNFVLSVVRGVAPKDELEAMLAVQMGAIHQATMMMARQLNHVDTIPQRDSAERALNKLARTYAMQMEALKRYRTSGEQKVTVEHVTVNAGGQAIVGAVTQGGRGGDRK